MYIIFGILAALVLVFLIGKMNLTFRFGNEVKLLFAQSNPIVGKTFNLEQLDELPAPVQLYFKRVLKVGQPYISYIRFTHDGLFKTDEKRAWSKITGEQYVTTKKPGFIWKGTTSLFVARDMYILDKGRLIVSLFSTINILDGSGSEYNQGELLRWLSESVLYPTNFLPSERLQWSAIDNHTAKLIFTYCGISMFFIVTFNEVGEITQLESKRAMGEGKLETWKVKASEYKEMHSVRVPTFFEVLWRLEKGDLSYAKFNIKTIEYDLPERL
jgi:hypothetical protein